MGSVQWDFAVAHYKPRLEPGETPLKLVVYASTPGKPGVEIRTVDSECLVGSITIKAPLDHPVGEPFIPNYAHLVVMDFFGVKTEDEVPVDAVNQLGTARIPIRELLDHEDLVTKKLPLVIANALCAQREWDGVKSELELTFSKPIIRGCKNPLMPPDEFCLDANDYQLAIKVLKHVQKNDQCIYERLKPTFPSLLGLQEPPDVFDGLVVPGSCYVNFSAERSPEEFYARTSRAALFRCYPNLSAEEAEAHFLSSACSEEEVGDVLATMFTIYSNFCTYLPDGTNFTVDGRQRRVDYEYFSNHLRTGQCIAEVGGKLKLFPPSGDCEDLQNEQAHQAMDFKDRKFQDPVLRKLVKARKNYLYAMSIMGVRGAQLSDGLQAEANADPYANQGGHSAGKLYHKETLLREHGLVNTAKPLFPTIAGPADFGKPNPKTDVMRIMEGTGPAHVREFDKNDYNKMVQAFQYLRDAYAGIFMLKPLSYNCCSKLNEFYRSVHVLEFPDLAAEGYRNSSFVVLDMKKDEPTLGATYTDFMNPSDRVGLRAQPERSDEEVLVLNQLMSMYPPIRAHQLPGEPEACAYRGPIYDQMYELTRLTAKKSIVKHKNATPVLFISPYNILAQEATIKGLKSVIQLPRVCAFEATEVALDEACGGYNIKIWVNPK